MMNGREVEAGQEARCTELGTQCVCSAPLVGDISWNNAVGQHAYFSGETTADASTKPCATRESSDVSSTKHSSFQRVFNSPIDDITHSSEATIMNALPPGRTVTRVPRSPDPLTNSTFIGHEASTLTTGQSRVAIRWYQYYSPNWVFTSVANGCTNGKIGQFDDYMTATYQNGGFNGGGGQAFYSIKGFLWTTGQVFDCCSNGPRPASDAGPLREEYRGKWWRYEMVVSRFGSPSGLRSQVFVKNVTDNLAERTLLDTDGTVGSGPAGQWTSHPPLATISNSFSAEPFTYMWHEP
ncbi:MAG: hypothetical protein JJE16_04340, partial [Nitrospiraceae bacterium]|nr:hypothetical protein [Nitrospiraceae bacterium]